MGWGWLKSQGRATEVVGCWDWKWCLPEAPQKWVMEAFLERAALGAGRPLRMGQLGGDSKSSRATLNRTRVWKSEGPPSAPCTSECAEPRLWSSWEQQTIKQQKPEGGRVWPQGYGTCIHPLAPLPRAEGGTKGSAPWLPPGQVLSNQHPITARTWWRQSVPLYTG